MFSRVNATKLCQNCRQDLVNLFELGFCVSPSRHYFSSPRRNSSLRHKNSRLFSSTSGRKCPEHTSIDARKKELIKNEGSTQSDVYEEQLAAVSELEKYLRLLAESVGKDETIWLQQGQPLTDRRLDYTTSPIIEATRKYGEEERGSTLKVEVRAREARRAFGDILPENELNGEELKIYKRLYGEPASANLQTQSDEVGGIDVEDSPHELLNHDESSVPSLSTGSADPIQEESLPAEESQAYTKVPAPVRGEIRLKSLDDATKDEIEFNIQDIAESVGGKLVEDEDVAEAEDTESSGLDRTHPLTRLGKFATSPKTIFLPPESFIRPIEKIMSNFSNKHLKEMCEKTFGGVGLPSSPRTDFGQKRNNSPVPLDAAQHAMGEMEANAFLMAIMPPSYAAIRSVLAETRKRLGLTWINNLLATSGGPRILDAGAGGAGILAWRDVVQAHWDSLHSSDRHRSSPPSSKSVVLTGSDTLRYRAATLLENTTFIPRIPNYLHTRDAPTLDDDRPVRQRKQFDVIIASHSLLGMKEDWMRKQYVQNLWSLLDPEGGVLILVEKGVAKGFEAIAGARELLLERYIAIPDGQSTYYSSSLSEEPLQMKIPGMIVAPCTNHEICPMYKIPGHSRGRKDFCSFQQRYIRPAHLQRILEAKDRNHEDVDFSYISVMKGKDLRQNQMTTWNDLVDGMSAAPSIDSNPDRTSYEKWMDNCQDGFEHVTPENQFSSDGNLSSAGETRSELPAPWNLPRNVFPPIKRKGHVTLDVCTPAGKIERWVVPKSFSKQAFRDARKAKWGDLWALGAKLRTPRNLSLGRADSKEGKIQEGREQRLRNQAAELAERMEESQLAELEEEREMEIGHLEAEDSRNLQANDLRFGDINVAVLKEWENEYESDTKSPKGKKGGAFAKFGKSTKEARRQQRIGNAQ